MPGGKAVLPYVFAEWISQHVLAFSSKVQIWILDWLYNQILRYLYVSSGRFNTGERLSPPYFNSVCQALALSIHTPMAHWLELTRHLLTVS